MDLPPSRNADPVLNVQAESQIRGYRVIVGLTGPLSQPQACSFRARAAAGGCRFTDHDRTALFRRYELVDLAQSEVGAATSLLTDALINAPAQRATSKLFGLTRFEINPVIGGMRARPAARLTLGRRSARK